MVVFCACSDSFRQAKLKKKLFSKSIAFEGSVQICKTAHKDTCEAQKA